MSDLESRTVRLADLLPPGDWRGSTPTPVELALVGLLATIVDQARRGGWRDANPYRIAGELGPADLTDAEVANVRDALRGIELYATREIYTARGDRQESRSGVDRFELRPARPTVRETIASLLWLDRPADERATRAEEIAEALGLNPDAPHEEPA